MNTETSQTTAVTPLKLTETPEVAALRASAKSEAYEALAVGLLETDKHVARYARNGAKSLVGLEKALQGVLLDDSKVAHQLSSLVGSGNVESFASYLKANVKRFDEIIREKNKDSDALKSAANIVGSVMTNNFEGSLILSMDRSSVLKQLDTLIQTSDSLVLRSYVTTMRQEEKFVDSMIRELKALSVATLNDPSSATEKIDSLKKEFMSPIAIGNATSNNLVRSDVSTSNAKTDEVEKGDISSKITNEVAQAKAEEAIRNVLSKSQPDGLLRAVHAMDLKEPTQQQSRDAILKDLTEQIANTGISLDGIQVLETAKKAAAEIITERAAIREAERVAAEKAAAIEQQKDAALTEFVSGSKEVRELLSTHQALSTSNDNFPELLDLESKIGALVPQALKLDGETNDFLIERCKTLAKNLPKPAERLDPETPTAALEPESPKTEGTATSAAAEKNRSMLAAIKEEFKKAPLLNTAVLISAVAGTAWTSHLLSVFGSGALSASFGVPMAAMSAGTYAGMILAVGGSISLYGAVGFGVYRLGKFVKNASDRRKSGAVLDQNSNLV